MPDLDYTKGDWRLEQSGNHFIIATGAPIYEEQLAKVFYSEANAKLMVNAAKMYEALKDIIDQAGKTRLMLGADLSDSIFVFGKQAIAAVEGEGDD